MDSNCCQRNNKKLIKENDSMETLVLITYLSNVLSNLLSILEVVIADILLFSPVNVVLLFKCPNLELSWDTPRLRKDPVLRLI